MNQRKICVFALHKNQFNSVIIFNKSSYVLPDLKSGKFWKIILIFKNCNKIAKITMMSVEHLYSICYFTKRLLKVINYTWTIRQ